MNPMLPSIRKFKRRIQEMIYPIESIATIRRGPLRGCRYFVNEQSGWAPILGRWEPDAQSLYASIVSPSETVWDLGANTGIHTLLFSRLVGPRGKVVAFEPLPVNAAEIRRTCELNGLANVAIVERAVSDRSGSASFMIGNHDKQGSLVGIGSESGRRIEVECMTLDQALDHQPRPDFVKIDIEGAESRALAGLSAARSGYPTFAIDLHTPAEDVAVGRWLSQGGYRVYRLIDDVARRNGLRGPMLAPIADLSRGWPNKDGIWGTIVAVHPSRAGKLDIAMKGAGQA